MEHGPSFILDFDEMANKCGESYTYSVNGKVLPYVPSNLELCKTLSSLNFIVIRMQYLISNMQLDFLFRSG